MMIGEVRKNTSPSRGEGNSEVGFRNSAGHSNPAFNIKKRIFSELKWIKETF